MNKNSPKYNLTKDLVADALVRLMNKMSLNDISITELTNTAQVARRTYYKHFDSKDDVITYILEKVSSEYTHMLNNSYITSTYEYGLIFFGFFKQYKTLLKTLKNHNLLFSTSYKMHKTFMTENKDVVERLKIHGTVYNLAYRFGGIFFMLSEWIENDCKEDVKELARLLEIEIKPTT